MMAELLRVEGYEVVEAENGQRALELLTDSSKRRPDLVLLDMAMPVMSGPELLNAMEQRDMLEELPVIVVSASSQPVEASLARAFIRKPPSMEQLYKLLREFCS
jgi:two-component system, OmpR family, response regulator CpxR